MDKPKLSLLARIFVNIGLTLQFYIPGLIYLFFSALLWWTIFTAKPGVQGTGLGFVFAVIFTFLLLIPVLIVYVSYVLWDRYGSSRNALCFLIAADSSFGLIWLAYWLLGFGQAAMYDPDVWLFSPLPMLVPIAFYVIALLLPRATDDRNHVTDAPAE